MAAALANDRGWMSSGGNIDADKVAVLEMALGRLPAEDPDRALVLATLCAELTLGSPLETRRALADEAITIAKASGDDAVMVRVLNHLYFPLRVPSLLEESLVWTADALMRVRSESVTRCCSSGRQSGEATWPTAPVTLTKAIVASIWRGRWPRISTNRPSVGPTRIGASTGH